MNQLPTNAMSMLRLMPSKAKEVATFSRQVIQAVKDGNANALEVQVMLKALELLSKEVREEIEEHVNREADKYSEKEFTAFGALIKKGDVHTSYDYTTCKDSEWEELDAQINSLTEKRKERETFLRALKAPLVIANRDSGEVEEVKPPVKRSKEGVKIYLGNV